jgi:hypothetical protein
MLNAGLRRIVAEQTPTCMKPASPCVTAGLPGVIAALVPATRDFTRQPLGFVLEAGRSTAILPWWLRSIAPDLRALINTPVDIQGIS